MVGPIITTYRSEKHVGYQHESLTGQGGVGEGPLPNRLPNPPNSKRSSLNLNAFRLCWPEPGSIP